MVIYHESITYPYEFPVGMSYEQQFTAFKPLAHRPKPMLAKP